MNEPQTTHLISDFKALPVPPVLHRAIEAMGYVTPTPIQAEAIPVALARRDVMGLAQTGTGKTAAFSIPLIAELLKHPRKNALVLVPTRELAVQVCGVIHQLLKFSPQLKTAMLIGGVPMNPQIKLLSKEPHIIVATPGRLVDHLRRGHAKLRATEVLVLDEADRMLDMGFAPQLAEIMRFVPVVRQTLLFSATMSPAMEKLAGKYLKSPVRVKVGQTLKPADNISQDAIFLTNAEKKQVLKTELGKRSGSVIVFTRTKHRADGVCRDLLKSGLSVNRIHGGRSQAQRQKALEAFRNGKLQILVATDLASRGIDVPHVAHVINFDLPKCSDDYIHRVGRTARAGAEGQAVSFVTPEERKTWNDLARRFAP